MKKVLRIEHLVFNSPEFEAQSKLLSFERSRSIAFYTMSDTCMTFSISSTRVHEVYDFKISLSFVHLYPNPSILH